jgi:hypothetical protein
MFSIAWLVNLAHLALLRCFPPTLISGLVIRLVAESFAIYLLRITYLDCRLCSQHLFPDHWYLLYVVPD